MGTFQNGGICAFCHGVIPSIMEGSHGCCESCKAILIAQIEARVPYNERQEALAVLIEKRVRRFERHLHGDEVYTYDGLRQLALKFTQPNMERVITWLTPDNPAPVKLKDALDFMEETQEGLIEVSFRVEEVQRFRRWLFKLAGIDRYQRFKVTRIS